MTMPGSNQTPRVPTPPRGDEIASYATYLEAQKAVDYLSDHRFPVEKVTIVGTDLRMVERVTGRLSYGRVATAGLFSGAWFGLLFGLLLTMMSGQPGYTLLAIAMGAAFGMLFSVISYAFTRGRRDFASSSQIVASKYALLCETEFAADARSVLVQMGGSGVSAPTGPRPGWGQPPNQWGGPWGQPTPQQPPAPPAKPAEPERAPDPRWTLPDGKPRYGAMRPADGGPVADAPSGVAPASPSAGSVGAGNGPAAGGSGVPPEGAPGDVPSGDGSVGSPSGAPEKAASGSEESRD